MTDVSQVAFAAGIFQNRLILMKFFNLTPMAVSLCLTMTGCSDSGDRTEVPPPPSETSLGEASGRPEDMLNDLTSDDETESEGATSTE
jgi:hypothetical protein